jgi:hypothetical protein
MNETPLPSHPPPPPRSTRQVFCHMKAGVALDASLPGADAIRGRLLATRLKSEWGCLSLTGEGGRCCYCGSCYS